MSEPEMMQCVKCGATLPADAKHFPYRNDRKCLRPMCKPCTAGGKREYRDKRTQPVELKFDWAALYRNSLLPSQLRKLPDHTVRVSAWDLRTTMHFQNGRCPFTGRPFVLPTLEELRAAKGSWLRWRNSLPREKAVDTPMLMQGDPAHPVIRGNLLWISACLEELYEMKGGAAKLWHFFREIGEELQPVIMPCDEHLRLYAELAQAGPEVGEPEDE